MPRYSEFGTNTFVGSPAQAECHVSSPTVQGYFSVLGWFDFEEGGGAVFELRMHMLEGVKEVLRQGPSVMAHAGNGPSILQWRKNMAEREGIRYTRCSVLDAVCLVRETTALLSYSKQKAMELKPWYVARFLMQDLCNGSSVAWLESSCCYLPLRACVRARACVRDFASLSQVSWLQDVYAQRPLLHGSESRRALFR